MHGSNDEGHGSYFEADGSLVEGDGSLVEGYKGLKMLGKWISKGFNHVFKDLNRWVTSL